MRHHHHCRPARRRRLSTTIHWMIIDAARAMQARVHHHHRKRSSIHTTANMHRVPQTHTRHASISSMVSDVAPLLDPKHPRGALLMVILGALSAVVVAHMLAETGLVPAFLAAWPTPPMDGWWAVGGLWMANSAGSIVVETMLVRMAVGVFAVAVAHAIFVFVAQPTVWAMVRAHKAVCSATTIASAPSAKAVVVLQDHADVRSTEDAHKESHSSWEHQDNDVNIIARDTRDLLDELFIFGFHAVSLAVGYEQYRASTYYPLFEASSGLWQDEGSVGDLTYALAHAAFWMHTLAQHVMRRPSDTVSLFHHTTSLTIAMLSFMPHLTHLAHALLLVMGSIDVLFRAVRCMKFVGWRFGAAGNVALAVFALSWLGTRHVLFVRILYSMFFEAPLVIYDDAALAVIRSLAIGLGLLQVPLMWWFVRVLQAVFRVVASSGDAVSVASSAFSASA